MNGLAEFLSGLGTLLKGGPAHDALMTDEERAKRRKEMMDRMRNAVADKRDVSAGIEIVKLDAEKHQVFGWASVIEKDGATVIDSQEDTIAVEELEPAVYDYVSKSRAAGEMHQRVIEDATLIESVMITAEKAAAMGWADPPHVGWWVGYQLDAETFAKVKAGSYAMFSIGGKGLREAA